MKHQLHFEAWDEDETLIDVIPERDLYLAVFNTAIHDLLFGKGLIRDRAVSWFLGASAPITFEEVRNMFKFTESRHAKLKAYIRGEFVEKPKVSFKRKYHHGAEYKNT